MVKLIWDEPKRLANISAHRIDFADLDAFDWKACLVTEALSSKYGNRRLKAIGRLRDEFVAVIFAPLGTEAISIISARIASAKERSLYGKT
jgi:uncharacterized DUF497 family protein